MHFKKYLLTFLFSAAIFFGFAQQNISVPLDDPVYNMLEYALLRNYCESLPNARPYTLKTVLDALNQILESPDSSMREKVLAQETLERLQPAPPTAFVPGASVIKNAGILLKKGFYSYEDNGKIPLHIEIGGSSETSLYTNFNAPNISALQWFDAYIKGDISRYFSYNVNIGAGVMKLDVTQPGAAPQVDSYAPNTFTQSWDSYQYLLTSLGNFGGMSNEPAAGTRLLPEFGTRLWDGKININFSRMRRDWGTGDGNLMLSKTARPFTALEISILPVKWLSLSALTGSLEYFNLTGIKSSAEIFQNNISAMLAELCIKDIFYAGITSSAIWVKRFELSYLNPGFFPMFAQSIVGDFDNVQMGLSLGLKIPKYAQAYYNLFIDEVDPAATDIFHQAGASMWTYQFGAKIAIPDTPFMTFILQYTKIEPYMYTHPLTEVPGYTKKMDTAYTNHGEPLGYKLKPNSAEIKIGLRTLPFWFLHVNAQYTLVQHGADYGSGIVHGSSYGERMVYQAGASSAKPGDYYYKDFLKDGVYEWIHSLGVSADMDLRFVKDIPLKIRLGYILSFTHHTEFIDGKFQQAGSSEYRNRFGNYLSLSLKLY